MDLELACRSCAERVDPSTFPSGCPSCDGALEFVPDEDAPAELPTDATTPSMWRYREALPLVPAEPITLDEGWTPLLTADLADGVTTLVKNETVNPTWSFKDRLNALVVSNVVARGHDRIVASSTGNHGASTAAYASRGGVEHVVVLVPHETEPPHRVQIRAHGAACVVTDFAEREALVDALVERGWYPTITTPAVRTDQPYIYEAYKTIAFEIVEQHGVPDAVVVPTGRGDGLYGVWKGFRDLQSVGAVDAVPRMIAAQSADRAPLVRAIEADGDAPAASRNVLEPADGPLPLSLSIGGSTTGRHALDAIHESGGTAYAISQPAVREATRRAGRAGLFLEPASALGAAAIPHAISDGVVDAGETVVCVATGPGAKWPTATERAVGSAPVIEPTIEALAEAVPFSLGGPHMQD